MLPYKKDGPRTQEEARIKLEKSRRLLMFSDSMMKSFFEPVLIRVGCPIIRAVNEAKKSGSLSVIYIHGRWIWWMQVCVPIFER